MGRAVVLGLLGRGARVAALDLSEAGLAETAQLAGAPEGWLTTHVTNVADRKAVLAPPDAVIKARGQVDGLLNIAGIIQPFVKINVSSMGGFLPVPGQAAYGASKVALKLFTEALSAESQGNGLAVTVVFPGGVATNITENSGVDTAKLLAAMGGAKAPKTTSVDDAAAQIIAGVEKGSFRVVIGSNAKFMDRFSRFSPRRATALIANQMKSLLG